MHWFLGGLLASKVWHYWVAFPLVAGGVAVIVALVVAYYTKVVNAKYPRQ